MDNNSGLSVFETELPLLAKSATAVRDKNNLLLSKALNKGQTLLDTLEGGEMSPELDVEFNNYLALCAKSVVMMNTDRKPITQMLTAIAGEFTKIENSLDKSKADTIPFKIQEARNNYARAAAAEQRRKEQELLNKQRSDAERIDIRAKVHARVHEKYTEILMGFKKKYNDLFYTLSIDPDNFKEVTDALNKMPMVYPEVKFNEIAAPTIMLMYVKQEELPALIFDSRKELYNELSSNFTENMEALKMHLIDQLPARKQELIDISKANKVEAKRLQDAADLRKEQEKLDLAKENQRREEEAAKAVETVKEVGTATLAFEKDIAQAEIFSEQTQSVKHSYVIQVRSNTGWMQVINLWFKEFGSKTSVDKVAVKKPESMKADLEKLAFNGGTRLDDSAHLVYEQDVKALTKKV
jgi:hypothetical protein